MFLRLFLTILVLNGAFCRRPGNKPNKPDKPHKPDYPRYPEVTRCEEDYGLQYYPNPYYCDQMYRCENGTLTEETCENGLLFDGKGGEVYNGCNYHWAVQCEGRQFELLPIGGAVCEYSFGIYSAGPCETFFYKCEYGESFDLPCEVGLAYDESTHSCNWPDLLLEYGCVPEDIVGFSCPEYVDPKDPAYRFLPFPRYAAKDPSKYITCVEGSPRLIGCGYGSSFNEYTLACEADEYFQ